MYKCAYKYLLVEGEKRQNANKKKSGPGMFGTITRMCVSMYQPATLKLCNVSRKDIYGYAHYMCILYGNCVSLLLLRIFAVNTKK